MRKTFIILTALFLVTTSYAQVRFGLKAGGNLANMDGFDQSKMRLGVSAGPVLQVNFAKMLFVQSEVLYSIKGRQSSTTQNNSNATLSLNYINLPILFGYRVAPNFSIKIGPEIGRLLSAKSKFDGSTTDVNNIYQDFDLGADLALAFAFKKLSLDLRYNYGLTDLIHGQFEDPNGNFITEESFGSNRVLQFSLCYFLK
jgi:hypothetical protein